MSTPPQSSTPPKLELRITRRFSASAERVFDAWLDPAYVARWLFKTPTGECVKADIDARVGGAYEIVERREGQDVAHVGTYLELQRPRLLVFTLAVPLYSADSDVIRVEIAPLEKGCELTLIHATTEQWAEGSRKGWETLLGGLAAVVDV